MIVKAAKVFKKSIRRKWFLDCNDWGLIKTNKTLT
jgi:hypothetical protein